MSTTPDSTAPVDDPLTLNGIKFQRARQHAHEVVELIETYRDSGPYENIPYENPTPDLPDTAVVDIPLIRWRANPPPALSGAIGDALQCFKSALDHAVQRLTLLHEGAGSPLLDTSEFPVYTTRAMYHQKRKKRIGGLPPRAQALIDDLQPIDRADHHRGTLLVLHELARIDRHRRIQIALPMLTAPTLTLLPKPGVLLEGGAPADPSQVDLQINLRTPICLWEAPPVGVREVRPLLEEIDAVVLLTVAKLAACAPS